MKFSFFTKKHGLLSVGIMTMLTGASAQSLTAAKSVEAGAFLISSIGSILLGYSAYKLYDKLGGKIGSASKYTAIASALLTLTFVNTALGILGVQQVYYFLDNMMVEKMFRMQVYAWTVTAFYLSYRKVSTMVK
jgi:hypothetical protein